MNHLIEAMIKRYDCRSQEDYEHALNEIIQEIALLGMWRAKFFEKGVFYGGTALRVLYGLDRFSEALDFSLLQPDLNFDLKNYEGGLQRELESFGFEVTVNKKTKSRHSYVESAFIKANTMIHLIKVQSNISTHKDKVLKIKLEVDTNPPGGAEVEAKTHFSPIPFTIKTYSLPSLFSGKISDALYRPYKFNTKGRDWYDLLWYVSQNVPINLGYLQARLVQMGEWHEEDDLSESELKELLKQRINNLDIEAAKKDVMPFVRDPAYVQSWTKKIFLDAASRVREKMD